ncbi:hypothetical protein Tco_0513599 [Tanacetum coccineum]
MSALQTTNLSFTGLDEFVNKPIVENRKSDKEVSKVVRKSDDSPIIEDWVLDSEEENGVKIKLEKNTHLTVKRHIHKNIAFKNSNIDQRVNTVSSKKFNTAKPKAVVNVVKENNVNDVKASACWAKTINEEQQLHALVDGKKVIITESTVRRDLQLEDEECVDCLPNATIFEQLALMGGPTEHVADEAVHKELGDSLVKAATTDSSLEAEQDSGNITKTRSKETPNESSSLGTTSGGGPKRQETIGDTIAQTRFENVSKPSMIHFIAEKTQRTTNNEIASLKRRVKKLEKKQSSRTHKLKRLYKVGLSARVESSRDEESLDEDASKQGRRINAIDVDENITLVNVQDDANKEMFSVDTLNVIDEEERIFRAEEEKINEANIAWNDIHAKVDADYELAERLQAKEQEQFTIKEKATLFKEL